jgi:hypothetical protein
MRFPEFWAILRRPRQAAQPLAGGGEINDARRLDTAKVLGPAGAEFAFGQPIVPM